MSFPDAFCCDPLKRHSKRKRYDLRPVSATLVSAHPSLCFTSNNRLCTNSRKELYCQPTASALLEDTAGLSTSESVGIIESEILQPSSPQMDHDSDWQEDDEGALHSSDSNEVEMESQQSDESEIIMQLKDKFNSTGKRSEKLRILTVLPKRWTLKKTMQVFGVSKYMAIQAKKLVQEKGVIAESREHDTVAVHLFQRKLIEFLTIHSGEKPKRICYMSDGCAAQYKNRKNFLNLCHHFADFGVEAEWHFFATSHGKSAGDGAGGTLKRLATKARLQRIYSGHILTPHDLYRFAVEEIRGMHFAFATCVEYECESSESAGEA